MSARLPGRVAVATCIACGARSREGDCPEGCTDLALDLVDAGEVDALAARLAALEIRIDALRKLPEAILAAAPHGHDGLREQARAALGLGVPSAEADVEIVEAWGCPKCGRIDAPQPCLGVCIRRPVLMQDASAYRVLTHEADLAAGCDRELSALARLLLHVRPRAGQEERSWAALRAQAQALLND